MEKIAEFLSAIDVKLDDLLLDPNNPRFAELGEEIVRYHFQGMANVKFCLSEGMVARTGIEPVFQP